MMYNLKEDSYSTLLVLLPHHSAPPYNQRHKDRHTNYSSSSKANYPHQHQLTSSPPLKKLNSFAPSIQAGRSLQYLIFCSPHTWPLMIRGLVTTDILSSGLSSPQIWHFQVSFLLPPLYLVIRLIKTLSNTQPPVSSTPKPPLMQPYTFFLASNGIGPPSPRGSE